MKIRNIYLGLKGQLPLRRFIRNFFVTKNAWGMFSRNSHERMDTKQPKVMYNTRESAQKAADKMSKKHSKHFRSLV